MSFRAVTRSSAWGSRLHLLLFVGAQALRGNHVLCSSQLYTLAASSSELLDELQQLDSRTIYIEENITVPAGDWFHDPGHLQLQVSHCSHETDLDAVSSRLGIGAFTFTKGLP